MKGYASGLRRHRIKILNRKAATSWRFGLDGGGIEWQTSGTVWASVDFVKGMRAMREGAIDAYAVVMVRMNWTSLANMRSRIVWEGVTYQILPETFHADWQERIIQFTAQAVINNEGVVIDSVLTYSAQDLSTDDTLAAKITITNPGGDSYAASYTLYAGDTTITTGEFDVTTYGVTDGSISHTMTEEEIETLDGWSGQLTAVVVLANETTGDTETRTLTGDNVVEFTSAYLFSSDGYGLFSADSYALVAANQ